MSTVRPFPARLEQHRPPAVAAPSYPPGSAMVDPVLRAGPTDERPAADLYVYRQRRRGDCHRGLVCEIAMRAFADGQVRGHEAVQPDRVAALVQHHATTAERPGLVTLLHRAGPAFTRTVEAVCRTPPVLDVAGPDGLEQTVWRVTGRSLAAGVTEEIATAALYIADGHHRVAAALQEWRYAGRPAADGLRCVVHPIDGLNLSAFHRRVTGPVDPAALLALLARGFRVRAVAGPPAPTPGRYGLYLGNRWYDVRSRGERGAGSSGLDVAVLQTRVLDVLARRAPGRAHAVEPVPAATPLDMLARRCDDDGGALFVLAPPPLDVVTRLADAGEVMPPKTTHFEPKPCDGIFLP